jgi:hypothetical protein
MITKYQECAGKQRNPKPECGEIGGRTGRVSDAGGSGGKWTRGVEHVRIGGGGVMGWG